MRKLVTALILEIRLLEDEDIEENPNDFPEKLGTVFAAASDIALFHYIPLCSDVWCADSIS